MITRSDPASTMTLLGAVSWSAIFSLLTVVLGGPVNETADAVDKTTSCSMSQFDCGYGICLPARWRCDGDKDCPSGKDEEGCADCLVYTLSSSVRKLCTGTPNIEHVLLSVDSRKRSIVPVDVDVTHGCVYHAEISDLAGSIEVTCLDKETDSSATTNILRSLMIPKPVGLSRDWVTGNLYWLQEDRKVLQIGVTSQDGKFTKVLYNGIELFDKPRGLAVHPGMGYLFWSDWSDVNPRIVRASMNGDQSSVTILAKGRDHLGWVNGLALDIAASKLFYTDSRLDLIGSMNLDGSDRAILIQLDSSISHPFGITISSDFIYWTDWKADSIFSAKRANFSEVKVVRKVENDPMSMALWAEKPAVPTVSPEVEAKCPYLRLLGHNNVTGMVYSQCYCPDGSYVVYHNGQRDCKVQERYDTADCLVYSNRQNILKTCVGDPYAVDILLPEKLNNIVSVDVDFKHQCVYYTNRSVSVVCLNKTTNTYSPPRVIRSSNLSTLEGIAFDWITGNIYYVEAAPHRLSVTTNDGRFTKVLYEGTEIFDQPRGLALHPGLGQLFWSDWSSSNPRIIRAAMNGDLSSAVILAQGKHLFHWVNGIALDIPAGKVYWVDAKKDNIGSMNVDGTNIKTFPATAGSHAYSMAVSPEFIYWTEWRKSEILAVRKTDVGKVTAVMKLKTQVMGIALWAEKPTVTTADLSLATKCPYLWLLGHNTTTRRAYGQCYCPDGFDGTYINGQLECVKLNKTTEASTSAPVDCLVYSNRTNILKFCVGDRGDEDVLLPDNRHFVLAVDVDLKHQCVYYTDLMPIERNTVEVVCLNQTTKIYSPPRIIRSNLARLQGIAYDRITGNVYCVEARSRRLSVTTNDGRFTKVLYDYTHVFDRPRGLAVHPGLGLLFWSDWSDRNPRIVRASMNGNQSSVAALVEGKDHFGYVNDLTLDIPAGKVYWVDSEKDNVGSMNMDGTNIRTFPAMVGSHPFSVAVTSEFIYWSDWVRSEMHAVRKTSVDDITVVKKLKRGPMGIALWEKKPSVEMMDSSLATKCPYLWLLGPNTTTGMAYGQCYCPEGFDGTYVNGQLECETIALKKTTEAPEPMTARPDDCLLYTSRNELRRICLGNHTTGILLKARKVSIMDVDVDYSHRCIFYTSFDYATYSLKEFCYHRWEKFTPIVSMRGVPDGLAYDWAGQNIYWLETTQKVLMVTDRMGRYRATLYSGLIFDQPRDLVLNPEKGDLFWADWSRTNPAIMQASMGGDPSSVKAVVKENLGWPNGLALDAKLNRLYWTDGKLDKIMMLDLTGNRKSQVMDLHSLSHHPFGIAVSDLFIYWSTWGNGSVLAVRKDAPMTSPVITVAQNLFSLHRLAVIPQQTKAPRPCSKVCPHLCLTSYNVTTREPDHVCRCADGFLPGKDRCGHAACLSNSTRAPVTTEIATTTTDPASTQPNKPIFPFTFTTIQGKNYTELTFTCRPLRLHRLCPVQCLIQVDFEDGRPCLKCVCQ